MECLIPSNAPMVVAAGKLPWKYPHAPPPTPSPTRRRGVSEQAGTEASAWRTHPAKRRSHPNIPPFPPQPPIPHHTSPSATFLAPLPYPLLSTFVRLPPALSPPFPYSCPPLSILSSPSSPPANLPHPIRPLCEFPIRNPPAFHSPTVVKARPSAAPPAASPFR